MSIQQLEDTAVEFDESSTTDLPDYQQPNTDIDKDNGAQINSQPDITHEQEIVELVTDTTQSDIEIVN